MARLRPTTVTVTVSAIKSNGLITTRLSSVICQFFGERGACTGDFAAIDLGPHQERNREMLRSGPSRTGDSISTLRYRCSFADNECAII